MDIIPLHVYGHLKHILNTGFSFFFHVFFLVFHHIQSSNICKNGQKHKFSPLKFARLAPLNDVRTYIICGPEKLP